MNYVRYFLIALLSVWLCGFLYIFVTSGLASGRSVSRSERTSDAEDESIELNSDFKKRFREAEKKLANLERKNREYEQLIRDLE